MSEIIFFYFNILTSRVENTADPDLLASSELADLDLHCFEKQNVSHFSMLKDKKLVSYRR